MTLENNHNRLYKVYQNIIRDINIEINKYKNQLILIEAAKNKLFKDINNIKKENIIINNINKSVTLQGS